MKQALLIIDVQNDYFDGGKNPLVDSTKALTQINRIEELFLKREQPIIYIQHIKKSKAADFFEEGTIGAELHPALKQRGTYYVVEKEFPNSFFKTELLDIIKKLEIEQLIITGMMTHMCVDSTTRASKELGFEPILISDGTATKVLSYSGEDVSAREVQLSYLSALRNFSEVMETETFIKR